MFTSSAIRVGAVCALFSALAWAQPNLTTISDVFELPRPEDIRDSPRHYLGAKGPGSHRQAIDYRERNLPTRGRRQIAQSRSECILSRGCIDVRGRPRSGAPEALFSALSRCCERTTRPRVCCAFDEIPLEGKERLWHHASGFSTEFGEVSRIGARKIPQRFPKKVNKQYSASLQQRRF